VTLTSPPLASASVTEGTSFSLTWTTSEQTGDTNPVYVQLWVYSGDTGVWSILPNANYIASGASGSYMWDTTSVEHGWYAFSAHVTDGDLWGAGDASPGWLHVELPSDEDPTVTFLTPTSGQSVLGGTMFDLEWSATVPTQDTDNMTMHLWAQHLVNGSAVWTEIATGLNPATGSYMWNTTGLSGNYYAFTAWIGYADVWVIQASANWVQVT
jgi:hypothetical protein